MFSSRSNTVGDDTQSSAISEDSGHSPVYHGTYQSKKQKYTLYAFIGVSFIMVGVAFILCTVRGLSHRQGALYFLLAISLVGFMFIEVMVLRMIRSGDLDKEKAWFVYFLGACTIVEALFVDIVVITP